MATFCEALAQVAVGVGLQFSLTTVAASVVEPPGKSVLVVGATVTLLTVHDGSVEPPHAATRATAAINEDVKRREC